MPPRFAKRTDANQAEIVAQLRSIPGVTVEVGHDDILVGRNKITYWIELKNPETVSKTKKSVRDSAIKKSQKKIRAEYTGHYAICWTLEQILQEIGITK